MEEKHKYKNVQEVLDIRGNGRKKLLVIGKTGTGKSTLCNIITGHEHDAEIFQVSSDVESCTQSTKFANVLFNGGASFPISLIDTIGFDDATRNDDASIIAELVDKLNHQCDHVNLFMIAVNGQNPRLDGSLVTMIKIFEGMFTKDFWKQVVVIFTRVSMDAKVKKKREAINKKSDEEIGENYIKVVEEQFPEGAGLKFLYLDAVYDKTDVEETTAFQSSMTILRELLNKGCDLSTAYVRAVKTQNQVLEASLKQVQDEREKHEQELEEKMHEIAAKNASIEEKERMMTELAKKFEMSGRSSRGVVTRIFDAINPIRYVSTAVDGIIEEFSGPETVPYQVPTSGRASASAVPNPNVLDELLNPVGVMIKGIAGLFK